MSVSLLLSFFYSFIHLLTFPCCCTFFFFLPSPLALSPSSFPPLPSHFSLSHSKEHSLPALLFIFHPNMLAGGERGGCCALPLVRFCHHSGQRTLPLTQTQPQLSAVPAWKTWEGRWRRTRRLSWSLGALTSGSSTGTTTAEEQKRATALHLWWKLLIPQQWPPPLFPPSQLQDPCGRRL